MKGLPLVTAALALLVACQPAASTPESAAPSGSEAAEADGEQLINTFLRLVKADSFTTRTEMSGVLSAGALQLAIQASGSLRGGSGTMRMKLNTVSDTVEFEAIFVGEFAYIREPGGEWQRVLRGQVNTSGARLDSFEFLTSGDDLRYDGTTTHDGVQVHVLVNTGPLSLTGGETGTAASGEATRLRILVLADGTPVFLSYHLTVSIDDGTGGKVAARGDIEQTFTDVGEPIVIEPPPGFAE
jgi:hypothetical protein